jgi:microcystin-dependent protein
MPEPFLAEVRLFAGNFAPLGWAFCNGQILSISQNTALFSLLGTTYGGNGQTTFALPDFRGRVPIHPGQGPGLSLRDLGEVEGSETVTLLTTEIPSHTHTMSGSTANGTADAPGGKVLARSPAAVNQYGPTADTSLAAQAVASSGGGQPHNNMAPCLGLSYIIALAGIYPSRPLTGDSPR